MNGLYKKIHFKICFIGIVYSYFLYFQLKYDHDNTDGELHCQSLKTVLPEQYNKLRMFSII